MKLKIEQKNMTQKNLEATMNGDTTKGQLNFFDELDYASEDKKVVMGIPTPKKENFPRKNRGSEIPKCPRCDRQHHRTEPCGDSE